MSPRPTERPLLPAVMLGVLAEALFATRLTVPSSLLFDEVHYVPAARALLTLSGPVNIEHPLFAKELIAIGIALFGDNALGWRALSTLAGTATVVGVYALTWLMTRRVRSALVAGLLAMLNFTVFVEARIAMLDPFMAAFLVMGIAALLAGALSDTPRAAWTRWLAGAVLLGLSVAAKWASAPFVAYAMLAVLVAPRRALPRLPAALGLGLVSVATYAATFAPAFFYARDPMTWAALPPFQLVMLGQQRIVLPHHVYESRWWSWPLMLRPIWFLYERIDGAQRGVLLLGNPVVMWGGLGAAAAAVWTGARERSPMLLGAVLLWAGAWLPFAIIPKSLGFYYYYYPASILLCVVWGVVAARFDRMRGWDMSVVTAALVLFVWFYPILAATPLADDRAFLRWMWFSGWI